MKNYFLTDYYEEPKSIIPNIFNGISQANKTQTNRKSIKENQVLQNLNLDQTTNMDFDIQDLNVIDYQTEGFLEMTTNVVERPSRLTIYFKRYNSFIRSPKVTIY